MFEKVMFHRRGRKGELQGFTLTHLSTASTISFSMWFKSDLLTMDCCCNVRFSRMEHCRNPWKSSCKSGNIKLYIQFKGEKLPICKQCWSRIAEKELEWGD
jgi:hypothetical protein